MVEIGGERLDAVFHALADPTRRAMLRSLASREHSVGELAAPYRMSLAAASKHIKALERAGLVERTVLGRTHRCRLAPDALAEAHEWIGFYQRFWNERLDALERALSEPDPTSEEE
jgi:DNA-binding transcriptional ArsR family regulator